MNLSKTELISILHKTDLSPLVSVFPTVHPAPQSRVQKPSPVLSHILEPPHSVTKSSSLNLGNFQTQLSLPVPFTTKDGYESFI